MSQIKQLTGTITNVRDLSPTARDYTIIPEEPLPFIAGAFVNIFLNHEGQTIRRAFSVSSSDTDSDSLTFSIRHSLQGQLTPLLWSKDFTGEKVRLMGPLGLNTADKMLAKRVFLFGFGVGAGVVKSLAEHIAKLPDLESLVIMTGNRNIEEILHKDYFDELANNNLKVSVSYVVSQKDQALYPIGYIQDHISNLNFNNSDVYMCGQTMACTALKSTIDATSPQNCQFFIEDFH